MVDPLDLLTAQGDLVAELGCLCPLLDLLLRQNQHLRHREQTDQGAGGVDALIQRGLSEHEPLSALHGVHADGGQQQAQRTGDQALQQGLGRHARDNGQAEDRKPEIFRRSEFHGQLRQQRSEKVQRDAGEQAAAEGGEAGHGQRLARLPLQGELVALNGGGGRGGGARRVDQNGGDGAAEDRTAVDSAQHDQSRFRGHGKGHGQQQRNAHGGGQAGQTADDDADGGAAGHKQQIAEAQAKNAAAEGGAVSYADGTYTGSGDGFGGTVSVEVTVSGGKITAIDIVNAANEDAAYLDKAKGIIDSMISANSPEVDTISGATFSSTGIKTAVQQALEGAAA